MREMKGYVVPILTPFDRDGAIDLEAMRHNIDYLLDEGIHGITLTGSFGEFPLLSFDERVTLYEVAVDQVSGRCAVTAGTAHANTDEVIRLNRAAEAAGVDGLMMTPPHYLLPSERDLRLHFGRIAESTALPITIYNNPPRTGLNMSPGLLLELSRLDPVVTVKQSSLAFADLMELLSQTSERDDFYVTNGQETRAFPSLLMGCQATYGVSPLLLGRECIEMVECARSEDLARGREIQFRVNRIRSTVARCSATPAAVLRELVNTRGLAGGVARAPIAELSAEDKKMLGEMSAEVEITPV